MGILDGALKGAVSGLADFGTAYMKQGFQESRDEREIEARRALQEDQYRLMEEREKNLAEFKLDMAEKVRARTLDSLRGSVAKTSGIADQFGAARDAYQNSSGYYEDENGNKVPIDMGAAMSAVGQAEQGAIDRAMTNPAAVRDGALAAGEFDIAKAVDPLTKDGMHNAPFGSTVLDERTGKVVYDGSADVKEQIEREKIAARKGKGGIIDSEKLQESVDKLDKTARTKAKELTEDVKHPYAGMDDIEDTKLRSVLGDAMSQTLTAAKQKGVVVNTHEVGKAMKQRLQELDKAHSAVIEARAASLFEDGVLKEESQADSIKKTGLDPSSEDAFKRSYRDQLLTMENLKKFRSDPTAYSDNLKRLMEASKPKAESEDRKLQPDSDGVIRRQGLIDRMWNGEKEAPEDWEPGQQHSKQSASGKIKY